MEGGRRDEGYHVVTHSLPIQRLRLLFHNQPTLCQRVALLQCVLKWQEHLLAVKSTSPSASRFSLKMALQVLYI